MQANGISDRRICGYQAAMKSELIISTYNSPNSLRMTLLSVLAQSQRPDLVCVADDGSGVETREMLESFANTHTDLPISHVWHEDQGFRKTVILNTAVARSDADYLIFTDGDCLLSPGFVARHLELANPARYCCGSMVRLSADAADRVMEEDIASGLVFQSDWLDQVGAADRLSPRLKSSTVSKTIGNILEMLSPVRRTFCGANASVFREAVMRVNGFDETMVWGGEDKEFGIRLANAGIVGRHLRYTAPILHLDHPRNYANPELARRQRAKIIAARRNGTVWTEYGIAARAEPLS